MIAICLSPVYILYNIFLIWILIKALNSFHPFMRKAAFRAAISILFGFFAGTVGLAFFMPTGSFERWMKRTGNLWLGVELYIGCFVTISLVSWGIVVRFRGKKWSEHKKTRIHRWFAVLTVLAIVATSLLGALHAHQLKVTTYDLTMEKSCGELDSLNIVMVADLHLGYNVGVPEMLDMVEKINAQNADIVLIAGDFFDNDYDALDDPERLMEILRGIKSRYGVYATYGNHDVKERLLVGFTLNSKGEKKSDPRMDAFLEQSNITLLKDEAVLVDESFYVVGRLDYEKPGFDVEKRKNIEELVSDLDQSKPIIVIDHEPRELHETAAAGVDLDLNGHTHDGQMFPTSIITDLVWENDYGYADIDGMHNIVTSGVGLFGPDMRVLTDAEICVIKVHFQKK